MSEEVKYKVGDEVLVRAKILEADGKTTRYPYLLSTSGWLSEEDLKRSVVEVPQKPKVTQAVMVWYEEVKSERADWTINNWLRAINTPSEVCYWLYGENHLENQHALATLIAYGPQAMEVEKEKEYTVELKTANQILVYNYKDENYYFKLKTAPIYTNDEKSNFTKQELINAGFGGVFDNEMFEVEEVE